jgi:hypothetical protein
MDSNNKFQRLQGYDDIEDIKHKRDLIINQLTKSKEYKSFQGILDEKKEHEAEAKKTIKENLGCISQEHINKIIERINTSYSCINKNGKINSGPWFGRITTLNARNIINADDIKINEWFNILYDNLSSPKNGLDLLRSEKYRIEGISFGFITLMLYLLDKPTYSLWFEAPHEVLGSIYPELEKYTRKSDQYSIFNGLSKKFAKDYEFEDTELDWVLTYGYDNSEAWVTALDRRKRTHSVGL